MSWCSDILLYHFAHQLQPLGKSAVQEVPVDLPGIEVHERGRTCVLIHALFFIGNELFHFRQHLGEFIVVHRVEMRREQVVHRFDVQVHIGVAQGRDIR